MTQAQPRTYVSAPDGNPQIGTFLTPINNTPAVKFFIDWLPISRPGMAPLSRGLEIGMAHGYWLVGPFTLLGPLRNEAVATLAGFFSASALIMLMTAALSMYAYVSPDSDTPVGDAEDWSMFSSGFLLGGFGGAIVAYLLIENADLLSVLPDFLGTFQGLTG
ncbi:MAG: photosystem I reaction center subunit XI [Cyanobacteria bacterium J06639_1]